MRGADQISDVGLIGPLSSAGAGRPRRTHGARSAQQSGRLIARSFLQANQQLRVALFDDRRQSSSHSSALYVQGPCQSISRHCDATWPPSSLPRALLLSEPPLPAQPPTRGSAFHPRTRGYSPPSVATWPRTWCRPRNLKRGAGAGQAETDKSAAARARGAGAGPRCSPI